MNRVRKAVKSLVALNGLKTSLTLLSTIGSPIPFVAPIAKTSLQIIQHAEQNREDCKDLARLSGEISQAILKATQGIQEHEVDDQMKADIADLQWRLEKISTTVQLMGKKSYFHRIFRTNEHQDAIFEHRECLKNAVMVFQIKEGISLRCIAMRNHNAVVVRLDNMSSKVTVAQLAAFQVDHNGWTRVKLNSLCRLASVYHFILLEARVTCSMYFLFPTKCVSPDMEVAHHALRPPSLFAVLNWKTSSRGRALIVPGSALDGLVKPCTSSGPCCSFMSTPQRFSFDLDLSSGTHSCTIASPLLTIDVRAITFA
ncbi:hypothetical protein A0H81_01618 [Grifola frondosa]|uniref:Uncharacterized protein n=1 Tax=Grifola frondosa TaxID=5627 RepID=A0A1C7MLW9_GRIFR|nr:hypothetical protein A0H81_01618 [Grifola frondosa]